MTSTVDEIYRQALSAMRAGNRAGAERLFKEALETQPEHAGALNVFGILLIQQGHYQEAEQYLQRALILDPKSEISLFNYGLVLRALNRPVEALDRFSEAIALNASVTESWNSRGAVYLDLGRFREAIADFDQAIAINSKFADALFNKGHALVGLRSYEAGLVAFDRALALRPDFARGWLGRGNALYGLRRFEDAAGAYDRALALDPSLAGAWTGRAAILALSNLPEDALSATDRALALQSNYVPAWSWRAAALLELDRKADALAAYDRAIAVDPNFVDALCGRALVLNKLGRNQECIAACQKALALNGDLAIAYNHMGVALGELGQFDKAREAYRRAAELGFLNSYLNLVQVTDVKVGDPEIAAMESLLTEGRLAKVERIALNFALGKAYADTKDYGRSFKHLLAGNSARRSTIHYDEAAHFIAFDRIEQTFSRDLIVAKSGYGNTSKQPIFVVGMPRSGSTLIEQMLASHPEVEGLGEVPAFGDAVQSALGSGGDEVSYLDLVPTMDEEVFKSIGEQYLARLVANAPNKERVTNKMLNNYLFAGLIHLVFPNSTIIHTVRDPVDTCLSCFSTIFRRGIDYSYDLGELGRHYARYRGLMDHWRRVLPLNRILDVRYEDVVADFESQARRILSHCKLPFDDRCLSFHNEKRAVQTASYYQVRQPVYGKAVGKWRAYSEFLAPLLAELDVGPLASI